MVGVVGAVAVGVVVAVAVGVAVVVVVAVAVGVGVGVAVSVGVGVAVAVSVAVGVVVGVGVAVGVVVAVGVGVRPPKDDPKYLKWVGSLPCVLCGKQEVQVAHYKVGFYTMGRKPANHVNPLCVEHHRLQHTMNEYKWWGDMGVNGDTSAIILRDLYTSFGPGPRTRERAEEWISSTNERWKKATGGS